MKNINCKVKIIAVVILFIFLSYNSFLYSQIFKGGNTCVVFGTADSAKSGKYTTNLILGDLFIGSAETQTGTKSISIGQWSFFLLCLSVQASKRGCVNASAFEGRCGDCSGCKKRDEWYC